NASDIVQCFDRNTRFGPTAIRARRGPKADCPHEKNQGQHPQNGFHRASLSRLQPLGQPADRRPARCKVMECWLPGSVSLSPPERRDGRGEWTVIYPTASPSKQYRENFPLFSPAPHLRLSASSADKNPFRPSPHVSLSPPERGEGRGEG